ncbi:hypothetical protein KIPB_015115, partial [Kipferlia bialata]
EQRPNTSRVRATIGFDASEGVCSHTDTDECLLFTAAEGMAGMEGVEYAGDHATTPDTHSILIYSSGTTGNPKGILLTNRNVMAGTLSMGEELCPKIEPFTSKPLPNNQQTLFSYLPIAHVFAHRYCC